MTEPAESRHTVLGHEVIVRRLGERLFRATCPEFPNLSMTGRSLEQALSRAQEWLGRQRDLTPARPVPEPIHEIVAEVAHGALPMGQIQHEFAGQRSEQSGAACPPAPDQAGRNTTELATPLLTKRDKLILNERAKLSATALNTIATATIAIGVLMPLVVALWGLEPTRTPITLAQLFVGGMVLFSAAFAIFCVALLILGSMEDPS